jgi:putative transposase
MKDLLVLLAHLLTTVAKLLGRGGARAVVADNLLMKQQLLVINRSRRRAPNVFALDRIFLGFWSLFLSPRRIQRAALFIRPSTLLRFHEALRRRKYRLFFSSRPKGKPGPKGPSPDLIRAIVEFKRRNPRFGCPRIALVLSKSFGMDIDKDIVRRVLAKHYRPAPSAQRWGTFVAELPWAYERQPLEHRSLSLRVHTTEHSLGSSFTKIFKLPCAAMRSQRNFAVLCGGLGKPY